MIHNREKYLNIRETVIIIIVTYVGTVIINFATTWGLMDAYELTSKEWVDICFIWGPISFGILYLIMKSFIYLFVD